MKKKEFTNVPIRSLDNLLNRTDSKNFEIDYIHNACSPTKVYVEPHRHDYYHIMLVENGYGVNTIDFKSYEVKPNALFFISPGQIHSIEIDDRAKGYVLSFNPDFYLLNDSLQKLLDFPFFHSISNAPVIYLEEHAPKISGICKELYEEHHHNNNQDNTKIIRTLLELLLLRSAQFYKQPQTEDKPAYLTFQLRKLESLIDTHFREYRALNDYADLMHISPKHLNSLCKKALNKTVTNLIHERTLTEAKRLLVFTTNTIAEIAYQLGFSDKSYFMRFFKKHTGQTADTYRTNNRL